ncbi:MAG: GNAT family N-acetyltransferase [Erythrobacter sp.]|nr:GNAT family N-acetyltransferase [Erythrobacter sp.]
MAFIEDLSGRGARTGGDPARPSPVPSDGFTILPWTELGNGIVSCWQSLASHTAAPNPFFEPWYLLPALRQFDPQGAVRLATFIADGKLVGLMPLAFERRYHGRPIPHLTSWSHANQFFGSPLIEAGYERAFWHALLDWTSRHYGSALFLHLATLALESRPLDALREVCAERGNPFRVVHREERAALDAGPTPEQHLMACLAKKRRKELDRKRRRLEELGTLVFTRHIDGTGLEQWADEFLALERAGWKGEAGSALVCDARTESLFRESLTGAAQSGRLERIAFHLDQRPIAMLASFVTPPHVFSFKTAYDDSLAKLSPGLLLQVENLQVLVRTDIEMTDSCAAPDHPMIDHFWRDRRAIGNVTIGIGGRIRRAVGAGLAALEARNMEAQG